MAKSKSRHRRRPQNRANDDVKPTERNQSEPSSPPQDGTDPPVFARHPLLLLVSLALLAVWTLLLILLAIVAQ